MQVGTALLGVGWLLGVTVEATAGTPASPAIRWTPIGARMDAPARHDGRITIAEAWPGVSLTLESEQGALTYRFNVSAGVDPGVVRVRYAGADGVSIEDDGLALRVHAGEASFREDGLRCFQQPAGDVPCRYACRA